MHRNAGFSLIELMIVVAIVAVLAAIAFPAYQGYVIRSQVAEAASLFGAPKLAVGDYYHAWGTAPNSNPEAQLPPPTQIRGKYVSQVAVVPGGALVATFGGAAHQALATRSMTLRPVLGAGATQWNCDGSALEPAWLPASCR